MATKISSTILSIIVLLGTLPFRLIEKSLMLGTALVPAVGYDKAAAIAKQAHKERKTVREVATEIEVTQSFLDQCVTELNAGELSPAKAAMAKLWGSELQNRVTDRCLQLFGGYGYMREYPIAVAYADARIATIYGGTSEIMKTIIAKDVLG